MVGTVTEGEYGEREGRAGELIGALVCVFCCWSIDSALCTRVGPIVCSLIVSRLPVSLSDRQHAGGLSQPTPFLRSQN